MLKNIIESLKDVANILTQAIEMFEKEINNDNDKREDGKEVRKRN
jgi:hypothetical protein